MKIGFCVGGFAADGDPLGLCALPMLEQAGYEYAEISITKLTQLEDAAFEDALALARGAALPILAGNSLFPGEIPLYDSGEQALAWLERAAQRCAQLGMRIMVFGSGKARALPEGVTREQAFDALAALLQKAAPIVSAKGITLVIEPLNHEETNMLCTVHESAELVRAVNDPAVRLLVDYFHFCREGDQLFLQDIPLLAHAHCAEPHKRACHADIDAPMRAFLATLCGNGYAGGLSVECNTPFVMEDVRAFPARVRGMVK